MDSTIKKRLVFKKETIQNLQSQEMRTARGRGDGTAGPPCDTSECNELPYMTLYDWTCGCATVSLCTCNTTETWQCCNVDSINIACPPE